MFYILGWIIYIVIVSLVVKLFYTRDDGDIPIYVAAIGGSFIGGFFNYLIGHSTDVFASSGILMGIVGTLVLLYGYDWVKEKVKEYHDQ